MFIYGALVVLGLSDALPIGLKSKSLKREVTLKAPRRMNQVAWTQLGSDIVGEAAGTVFGYPVRTSSDGSTAVIGNSYYGESGGPNNAPDGRALVYRWDGTTWNQLGDDIPGSFDRTGAAVDISSGGNIVAIGGYANSDYLNKAGTARVYTYDSGSSSWIQLGQNLYGKAAEELFGTSVSLSSDGQVIAIGVRHVNNKAGAVRIYRYSGSVWSQVGSDIDGEVAEDNFGYSVSISSDGNTVIAGAHGINRNLAPGYAAVYRWDGTAWIQLGSNIDGEGPDDMFGLGVDISSDGTIAAIAGPKNDGAGNDAGHVRVFGWDGTEWSQLGSDIDGEDAGDAFGNDVSLSSDGTAIAIGCSYCAQVKMFHYDGTTWLELGTESGGTTFGATVSLSSDATSLAVGAHNNGNGAPGYVRAFSVPASWTSPSPPPSSPPTLTTTLAAIPDATTTEATSSGDPHLHFAHGGVADFRGRNASFYALLSAPGIQFSAQTVDTDFLLPRPQLVHGSFFFNATWTVRGASGRVYAINSDANAVGFTVVENGASSDGGYDAAIKVGTWDQWSQDGIVAMYRQSTLIVRAHGWEVNATRHPIYNHVAGPSKWRFDMAMRPLDGTTGFEAEHGTASKTCFPHGLIGQSWDGDKLAINGAIDDYTFKADEPVITTKAMAEGSIEGVAAEYELAEATDTGFVYSRFAKTADAICAPRDVKKLAGKRASRTETVAAGSADA